MNNLSELVAELFAGEISNTELALLNARKWIAWCPEMFPDSTDYHGVKAENDENLYSIFWPFLRISATVEMQVKTKIM